MHVALLVFALQLQSPALNAAVQRPTDRTPADSARELGRARRAQLGFEQNRRAHLPFGDRGGGRCDVRLGRYCWWYDENVPTFPPEERAIVDRREELIRQLDSAGTRFPGDDWLAGMRVHYRIDGHHLAAADSVARECRASAWWCSALAGYAAHSNGDARRADSAFALAVAALPPDAACSWRDIGPLLNEDDRDIYEHHSCDERRALEAKYWLLSRPQFSTAGNEYQNEFNVRRVLNWLGERAATPHLLSWGKDAGELLLRYGWPTAWSRVVVGMGSMAEPSVIGHDPAPSFSFAPLRWLADSLLPVPAEAWDMKAPRAEARYAPPMVKRVANVAAQFARFRRGDSTLLVAAFAARDDSLRTLAARLGAADANGLVSVSEPDTSHVGRVRVMMATAPWVVGIDITDTTTRTLGRTRSAYAPGADSARLSLSDLLVYRAGEEPASSLDSALASAIPGDTVTRNRALGIFWETYGLSAEGETVDIAVSVERLDHGWIRSARQKLRLTPVDTPIRIKWTDARTSPNKAAPHAISLDLGNLDSGRYQIALTLTPVSGSPVVAVREVELIDR